MENNLKEMKRISLYGTEEEKKAFSKRILQEPMDIISLNIAEEMGIDVQEHYRKLLDWDDFGWQYMMIESILRNSFLDDTSKYNLVIQFYEKLLTHNILVMSARATKLLEKYPMFHDYLEGKKSSTEYSAERKQKLDNNLGINRQENMIREITRKEATLKEKYNEDPSFTNYMMFEEERQKNIDVAKSKAGKIK